MPMTALADLQLARHDRNWGASRPAAFILESGMAASKRADALRALANDRGWVVSRKASILDGCGLADIE